VPLGAHLVDSQAEELPSSGVGRVDRSVGTQHHDALGHGIEEHLEAERAVERTLARVGELPALTPRFELIDDLPGQQVEHLDLSGRGLPRRNVDGAETPEDEAVSRTQGRARVEADPRATENERILRKAGVIEGVAHHETRVAGNDVSAKGDVARPL